MVQFLQDTILSVQEVADLLHVHPNTVRLWNNRGLLKAYRLGTRGDRRFTSRDLEAFLNRTGSQFGYNDANQETEAYQEIEAEA